MYIDEYESKQQQSPSKKVVTYSKKQNEINVKLCKNKETD